MRRCVAQSENPAASDFRATINTTVKEDSYQTFNLSIQRAIAKSLVIIGPTLEINGMNFLY